ncbi:hypothetical protein FE257_003344 [Aspergillus nanangensis]|uniref:Uncharacterized protein n=1 Tax=Aspergillus nanangensis TaxID=2582783 RepID=A0AAD4CSE3_ASPNN|nr:hypothetical protein FE257_003344 [Aspergillus nanangensis]
MAFSRFIPRPADKHREAIQHMLETLLRQVYRTPVPIIPEHVQRLLAIDLQPLDLQATDDEELPFFMPWTASRLANHEISAACIEATDALRQIDENLQVHHSPLFKFDSYRLWDLCTWVRPMCQRLEWEVRYAPRTPTRGWFETIDSLSGWRCYDALPFCKRLQSIVDPNADSFWCPENHWTLPGDHPHIKISLYHSMVGIPGLMTRGELLTILAVMISRLERDHRRRHLIVPVMLFSFMGPRHGRILLAHFNGSKLIVRMTRMYRFLLGEHQFEENLFLFTRYLASATNPRDDTTRLPTMAEI